MTEPRLCHKCDKPVSRFSKTGYCRPCYARIVGGDKHLIKKRAATRSLRLRTDPEAHARQVEHIRKHCLNAPAAIERRKVIADQFFRDPEMRAKAAMAARESKLKHVPAPMRELYLELGRKGIGSAAERTEIVLAEYRRLDPVAAAAFERGNIINLPTRYTGWRKTIADVAEAFGLTFADVVTGGNRFNPRPDARAVCAMLFLDKGWSTTMVAGRIGLTDHTTVVHYRKTWAQRCKKRRIVAEVYARFRAERLAA